MSSPVLYETPRQKAWGHIIGWGLMLGLAALVIWWRHREPAGELPADPVPRVAGYNTVPADHGIYLLVPEEIKLTEPEEPDYRP